jgi:hypothetical protein
MGCLISFEVESIYKYMADVKLKLNINIEKKNYLIYRNNSRFILEL